MHWHEIHRKAMGEAGLDMFGFHKLQHHMLILSFTLLLSSGLAAWCCFTLLQEPSLGVHWRAAEGSNGIVVASFTDEAVKSPLSKGGTILVVSDGVDPPVQLSRITILEDPDLNQSYDELNNFFAHQSAIAQLLQQPQSFSC